MTQKPVTYLGAPHRELLRSDSIFAELTRRAFSIIQYNPVNGKIQCQKFINPNPNFIVNFAVNGKTPSTRL